MLISEGNRPHQNLGKDLIYQRRAQGVRRLLAVAPCGAGKSRVMRQLALEEVARGGEVRLYLHRSLLLQQMIGDFERDGIDFGVLAAGYPVNESAKIQLCMADSVYARAVRGSKWGLGEPSLVMFDEAHNQTGNKARSIVFGGQTSLGSTWKGHYDAGAFVLGFTGTPVDVGDMYEDLILFANYKEMRHCKAHLPVRVYSPSEIDTKGVGVQKNGDFNVTELDERVYCIIGDVFEYWQKYNPEAKPAILFAPSVAASKWFAAEFCRRGVPVAHLDGEVCMVPQRCPLTGGWLLETFDNTAENRAELLDMSRTGEIKMICNRFVLREAIDMPWLYHGILATAFGAISSYLQSVGRLQRYFEGMEFKILQDHGGNYWRHGSPNQDRAWELGCTNASIARARLEAIRKADSPDTLEGVCCWKCFGWRQGGVRCPHCGAVPKQSVRRVRSIDGELKLMRGVVNKKKKGADANKIWLSVIYGSVARDRPVSSAVSLFYDKCKAAGIVPSLSDLKNGPPAKDSADWHRSMRHFYPWAKPKFKKG